VVSGGTPLRGEVEIHGAKNAILPILAASLLTDEAIVLHKVPLLDDVYVMCEILKYYGSSVERQGSSLIIQSKGVENKTPPEHLMKKMRASNLILGPLLSRFGSVCLPFPGGCDIGSRPMNYHTQAICKLGATVNDRGAYIEAKLKGPTLVGSDIYLDFPSVGATENAMMAAVSAKGETIIYNAAREPEVLDLAVFLRSLGADIRGAGKDVIMVRGVKRLFGGEHEILPDRIEAGTMMIAAAITKGDVLLRNFYGTETAALIAKLKAAGIKVINDDAGLRVLAINRAKATDIRTMPYPGFPTDVQPQFMALMATAKGNSLVVEGIFENRFRHAGEMCRMGADIQIIGDAAIIKGRDHFIGTKTESSDLRAGAALVLLGLVAEGNTIIENVYHIDRGYESFEISLQKMGANIQRVTE